jgi:DNA recombination protein RmuC
MDSEILLILGGILLVVLILLTLRQQNNNGMQFPDKDLFVSKDLYSALFQQHEQLREEMSRNEDELRSALSQLAAREQQIFHLEQSMQHQKAEVEQLQARFKTEFENIANRLLEEKSQRFTEQNARNLQSV